MCPKILSEKLLCQLTLFSAIFSIAIGAMPAHSEPPVARFSVRWQNLPLSEAVDRVSSVTGTPIFLDRRVAPEQRVTLTASDATVADVLNNLAHAIRIGHGQLGRLHYLGPRETADGLAAVAVVRRNELATLDLESKNRLSGRRRLVWPRLAEPRGLVVQLAAQHGWQVANPHAIPHDLWAAGELPAMPLIDQLTILLAGFDLTFRIDPQQRLIVLEPARWPKAAPRQAARRHDNNSRARGVEPSNQVFTLRVENQPVGRVLDQLAKQLGWKLDIDDAAIHGAGLSLEKLVTFEVKNASEAQLIDALLAPAGLAATPSGDRLRIAPQ